MREIDWAAIESAYRAGGKSNRALAKEYGVSESAIRKKAGAEGWEKGKRTDAHLPSIQVMMPERSGVSVSKEPVEHSKELVGRLLSELDEVTAHIGEIEAAIEAEAGSDESPRRYNAMMKAVSLPVRAETLKKLVQATKDLRDMVPEEGMKKAPAEQPVKGLYGTRQVKGFGVLDGGK